MASGRGLGRAAVGHGLDVREVSRGLARGKCHWAGPFSWRCRSWLVVETGVWVPVFAGMTGGGGGLRSGPFAGGTMVAGCGDGGLDPRFRGDDGGAGGCGGGLSPGMTEGGGGLRSGPFAGGTVVAGCGDGGLGPRFRGDDGGGGGLRRGPFAGGTVLAGCGDGGSGSPLSRG